VIDPTALPMRYDELPELGAWACVVSVPLRLAGGVASPANAVAII
jgi:hypothetical protein